MTKFAIIGSNFISDKFVNAGKNHKDFKLEAVYSRTQEKAEECVQKWGAAKIYTSIDKMLLDKDIDAVYIASPNKFHFSQSLAALKAGKHVICEKPITLSMHELEQLLEAAKENNVIIMEAVRGHFAPSYRLIKENLYKLGKIRRAVLSYCQYSSRYDKFKQGIIENAFNPTLGNGALMDIGVYCVHSIAMLFGMPKRISAFGWFLKGSIDADGTIVAEYDEMSAQLIYSKVNNSFIPSEIQGEKGSIVFSPLSVPTEMKVIYNDGTEEIIEQTLHDNDMTYEVEYFIDCIEGKRSHKEYNDYSVLSAQILDEVRRQIGIDFIPKQ